MAFGKGTEKVVEVEAATKEKTLGELFTPATQLTAAKGLKIAVWGRAKVGKSHFALTAAQKGKVFVIDTETAMKINVRAFPDDIKNNIYVIDVLQYSGLKEGSTKIDYAAILAIIEDAVNKILEAVKNGEDDITVVIDSASDLWDWLGIWLGDLPGVKKIGSTDKVNRLEWEKANRRYEDAMLKLKMCGCNMICTYKAKNAVGSDGADLGYAVPRWQKNSKHIFDVVGVIEKVGDKRTMKFTGSDNGGRYGDKIPDIDDPSWSKLIEHLEKHCKIKLSD